MEIYIIDRTTGYEYTTTKYDADWKSAHEAALRASGATSHHVAESQYGITRVSTAGGVMTFAHTPAAIYRA